MVNRGQLVLGAILVLLGLIFLIGTVFQINIWGICWPVGLILLGVWMIARPRLAGPDKNAEFVLLGDARRRGPWVVRGEEIWLGVGDADLDLTQAVVPEGESRIAIYCFVGDIDILIPQSVGVIVQANGFVVDSELLGGKLDAFMAPVEAASANYPTAPQKICIDVTGFVVDIKVRHV